MERKAQTSTPSRMYPEALRRLADYFNRGIANAGPSAQSDRLHAASKSITVTADLRESHCERVANRCPTNFAKIGAVQRTMFEPSTFTWTVQNEHDTQSFFMPPLFSSYEDIQHLL
jgi:hypothetical protein